MRHKKKVLIDIGWLVLSESKHPKTSRKRYLLSYRTLHSPIRFKTDEVELLDMIDPFRNRRSGNTSTWKFNNKNEPLAIMNLAILKWGK